MKKQFGIRIRPSIKFLAVPLMTAGIILNSAYVVAQVPVPLTAMMQSAGAQTPVPPRANANGASDQQAHPGHLTKAGKTEVGAGFFLFGAGILTISATAFFVSSTGFKPSGAKTAPLYIGGAGLAAVGVTLITFGFHRRSAK